MMPNVNGRFVPVGHAAAVAAEPVKVEEETPEVEAPVKKAPAKRATKKKGAETAAVVVGTESADK